MIRRFPQSDLIADALYAKGVAQAAKDQDDPAAATFAEFLRRFPNHPLADECRLRQGEALLEKGKSNDAEKLFAQAAGSKDFPHADHALIRQAGCVLQRGQAAEAAKLYRQVAERFPESPLVGVATLSAGKALFLADRAGEARQVLGPLADKADAPERFEATYWIGRCWLKEKNPAEALKAFEKGLGANPPPETRPLLLFGKADALTEIPERRAEAVNLYAEAARAAPDGPLAPEAWTLAAFTALEVGKLDEARQFATEVLNRYPKHELRPEALFVAAEADLRAGRPAEAEGRYRDLIQHFAQSPRAEEARVHRGLAMALQGKHDEAIRTLRSELPHLKDKEQAAHAHHLIGRSLAEVGKLDEAIREWQAAITAKGDWSQADETRLALAYAFRVQEKYPQAVEQLNALRSSFPNSPVLDQALVALGECASAQGKLDEAINFYREAAGKNGPAAPSARLGIARVLVRKGDAAGAVREIDALLNAKPPEDLIPRARYVRALAEHQQKQYGKAIEDAQAFLDSKPGGHDDADALLVIGLCHAAEGRHEDAARTFRSIVNAHKDYPQADQVYYELAFSLQALKQDAEAADAFQKAAAAAPKGPLAAESLLRLGEAQYDAGRFDDAARAYDEALKTTDDPTLKEKALHKLGWCAFRRDDWNGAASRFDQQTREFPNGPLKAEGLLMAGESLARKGDWNGAFHRLTQALQAGPFTNRPRALFRAGEAASQLKNWSAAVGHFREFLNADPKSPQEPEARYGLGWALQNQEQYPAAIEEYQRVVSETDTETAARAQFMIGECRFAMKEHAEAARQFLKAAYGYPYEEWAGNSHFEAARCFEVLGQIDQAKQSYRAIVEKYPKHDKAKAAADRLKELQG